MMQALAHRLPLSRRLLIGAAIGAVSTLAALAGLYFGAARLGTDSAAVGSDAGVLLGVTLPDVSGKPQPLSQWRGKVLIVNFWATWCGPCREEMPEFVQAQGDLGPKGLQFVGIAVDSADKVAEFAQELHLNYPALIGGYGAMELSKTLGNRVMALPFTVVVDRSGRIAHTQLGPLREEKLRTLIAALL